MQTLTIGEFRITTILGLKEALAGGIPGGILPDAAPGIVRSMNWLLPDLATAEDQLKINVMHHPCQIEQPEWSSDFDTDKAQSPTTRIDFVEPSRICPRW